MAQTNREEQRDRLRQEQRDAIWKWRWLGLRRSTPAFKISLVVLAIAAGWILANYVGT